MTPTESTAAGAKPADPQGDPESARITALEARLAKLEDRVTQIEKLVIYHDNWLQNHARMSPESVGPAGNDNAGCPAE